MLDNDMQEILDDQGVSRRDFLKFCSLMIGALVLPHSFASKIEQMLAESKDTPFNPQQYFQWQNEYLCKTIYPMREVKLRDFLIYYMEVDVWSQYKGKDINTLKDEVAAYKKTWELNAVAAQKEYTSLRDYFLRRDVRVDYFSFQPIDELELTEINNLHDLFAGNWPRDIRGERSFVERMISYWVIHRDAVMDRIKALRRRHEGMLTTHSKYVSEGKLLDAQESITLPMAEHEMDQLRAFLATYNKIEQVKLAWYKLSKSDPNFNTPEAEFIIKFPSDRQISIRDIAYWKVDEYTKSIAKKNQYELLDLINQRFQKEPQRFPQWLQYMVVHFSGMRYASAHGSWVDPKDLMIRLRVFDVVRELKDLDDSEIVKRCKEKIEIYESTGGTDKPKLALTTEKEWMDKILLHLTLIKANGPKTRRSGLIDLQTDEVIYEIKSLSIDDVLQKLMEMKSTFPKWAWKEIVRFTPLRVTEVSDLGWEKLTPQEMDERNAQQSNDLRSVMNAWENHNPIEWRDEHGRTLELIVTRAVCNEVAEHCQHIRGHLPPGGLAARAKWYVSNEKENKFSGAYYVKPTSEKDYIQGASILWLRFISFSILNPSQWQKAKWIETKQKIGLLPAEYKTKKEKSGEWLYKINDLITRSRTTLSSEKQKMVETQWLRWIHEATVAEVAETADGMMVITYETALPGGDNAKSAVGTFKAPLRWLLSDGTEDQYNRSFVGYIPEGQIPLEHLKTMLDWNKIFRK